MNNIVKFMPWALLIYGWILGIYLSGGFGK